MQRFRAENPEWWKQLDCRKYGAQLGGEAAAAILTRYLRPEIVTLYARKADPRLIMEFRLRVDPAGPVEFVDRFWAFEEPDEQTVPLPLIYADLVMTGDARCLETAELIHQRIVDGPV
jgi:hypothetical protein